MLNTIKTKLNAYKNSAIIAEKHGNYKKLMKLNSKIAVLEKKYWTLFISKRRLLTDVSDIPTHTQVHIQL